MWQVKLKAVEYADVFDVSAGVFVYILPTLHSVLSNHRHILELLPLMKKRKLFGFDSRKLTSTVGLSESKQGLCG